MIPISICNHKGGTAKTTSALMIGAALGLSGSRVLIVDLDPQGFLSRMTGLPEPPEERSSLALFDHERPFDPSGIHEFPSFSVLPASTKLSSRMRRLTSSSDVFWVKESSAEAFGSYDYVLYDTSASLTVYTINALVASRHVLIPVLPEYQPVIGAEQTHRTAGTVAARLNPDLDEPIFLLTMVDARKRNHRAYSRYLREHYEDRVMDSVIRTNASLSVTRHDGLTVFDTDPHGRGALDYANAVDELSRILSLEDRQAASAS